MPDRTLYRLAGYAGAIAAIGILLNTARLTDLVPDNALTEAVAPPPAAIALFVLTGLYFYQREQVGRLGLVGFVLNLLGLAGLFAIEFVRHAIFQYLDPAQVSTLVAGPTRAYLLVVAVTFVVGVVLFAGGSLRARVLPVVPIVAYLIGFTCAGLGALVPRSIYIGGLVVGALATFWLAVVLIRRNADTGVEAAVSAPHPVVT